METFDQRTYQSAHLQELQRSSKSFRLIYQIAFLTDRLGLDPLLGVIPYVGDVISATAMIPTLYLCAFRIKSFPLTLAVLWNSLVDMLLGTIPFLGIFLDFIVRSNQRNVEMVVNYLEQDEKTIKRVNRYAAWLGLGCMLIGVAMYGIFQLISLILSQLL